MKDTETVEQRWSCYQEIPGVPAELPVTQFAETVLTDLDGLEDILQLRTAEDGKLFLRVQCEDSMDDTWAERELHYAVSQAKYDDFKQGKCTNLDIQNESTELYLVQMEYNPTRTTTHLVSANEVSEYFSTNQSFWPS